MQPITYEDGDARDEVLPGAAGGENLPTDLSEREELLDLSTDRY
jgi:hypothetical protein